MATAATAHTVTFADTPKMLGIEDLIDYSTKRGLAIFEQGCMALDDKALTKGFHYSSSETLVRIGVTLIATVYTFK